MRVHGTVYDETRSGIPAILVSNGEEVVLTDSKGGYEIIAEPDIHSFIFISVPDMYRPEDTFYQAVPSGTKNPLDFTLLTDVDRTNEEFVLAQITDTHVRAEPYYRSQGAWLGPETGPRLTHDLNQIERESNPDLILATGDLTDTGTIPELKLWRDSTGPLHTPIYPVYGGHDGSEEMQAQGGNRDKYEYIEGISCVQNYQRVIGPFYYSFNWGGRHFIAFSKEDSYLTTTDRVRKDSWLINDLSSQPDGVDSVVFMHTPPAEEFLELIAAHNVKLVLFGHTHSSKAFEYKGIAVGGPTPLCFGGYDTNSRGYRLVRFTRQGFDFDLVQQTTKRRLHVGSIKISLGEQECLKQRWETQLPGPTHRAEPVRVDETYLYSVTDDNLHGHGGVYAIDVNSGDQLWSIPSDSSIKNSVSIDNKGVAVGVSITGQAHAFNTNSGELLWQSDLPGHPFRWIYSRPAIADGIVYFGGKAGYQALEIATGKEIWYKVLTVPKGSGDPMGDGWGSYPSPIIYRGLVILHLSGVGLVALDRETGEIIWENPLEVTHYYSDPVLAGDLIVCGGFYGNLAAVKAYTGETLWQRSMPDAQYPTNIAIWNDRMYVTTNQGHVRSMDLSSNKAYWDFQSGEDLLNMNPFRREVTSFLAKPIQHGNSILIGGVDGVLYTLDIETGQKIATAQFPAPITATPVLHERNAIVSTWDGHLRGFCF